jgi:hypothetical protein
VTDTLDKIAPQTAEGVAVIALVNLVAASSTLIERLKVDDVDDAAQFIHWPWANDVEESERPFIAIEETEYSEDVISGGFCNNLMPQGVLTLNIADNAQHLPDLRASVIEFTNFAGGIVRDVADRAGDGTNSIVRIVRVINHTLSPIEAAPANLRYWWTSYSVFWTPVT